MSPSRHRALHGILLAAPHSVFATALLFKPGTRCCPSRILLTRLTFSYLLLFLLASFMVQAATGGPEWGTRYGLIIFPLLTVLATVGISSVLDAPLSSLRRRSVLLVAAFAFAIACQSSVRGITEIQVTKRDLAAFESRLRSTDLPAVTDLWWLGAAISPYFVDNELYTVCSPEDVAAQWLPAVPPAVSRFVYMSYGEGIETISPAAPVRLLDHAVINGMSFRTYEVRRE